MNPLAEHALHFPEDVEVWIGDQKSRITHSSTADGRRWNFTFDLKRAVKRPFVVEYIVNHELFATNPVDWIDLDAHDWRKPYAHSWSGYLIVRRDGSIVAK